MCWAQIFVVCVLSSVVGSSVVPVLQSGGVRGSACFIPVGNISVCVIRPE